MITPPVYHPFFSVVEEANIYDLFGDPRHHRTGAVLRCAPDPRTVRKHE